MQTIKLLVKPFEDIFRKVSAITGGLPKKPSSEPAVKIEPIESEYSKLARDGRKFDRAKLDSMLIKLSESPTLEVLDSPRAMCYSIRVAKLKRFEYVCKACGTHTIYNKCWHSIRTKLPQCRQAVDILRAKGLDISLDESPLCMKCRSAKELNIQTHCTITKEVNLRAYSFESELSSSEMRFLVGDTAEIVRCEPDGYYVFPIGQDDSEDNPISRGICVPKECIGDISYDEINPSVQRIDLLAWIINGKSVPVELHDVDIMMTFLNGEEIQYNSQREGWPLKCEIKRLCELLGSDTVKSAIKPLSVKEIFMGGRWRA